MIVREPATQPDPLANDGAATLPRRVRLRTAADFQAVFGTPCARRERGGWLVLARLNGLPHARLGLAVSRKNLKTAVGRNRVKRLARESFRLNQDRLSGLDLVVLSRRETGQMDNQALTKALERLWSELIERCAPSSSA